MTSLLPKKINSHIKGFHQGGEGTAMNGEIRHLVSNRPNELDKLPV